MVSFARNRELIADSEATSAVHACSRPHPTRRPPPSICCWAASGELESSASELRIPGFWGPRAAPELREAVQAVYLERLRAIVNGPVQAELTADVRAIGSLVRVDAENFKSAYDDLKLYLMLTRPEHLNVDWATPKLTQVWLRAMGGEGGSSQERVEAHARRYLDALSTPTRAGLGWPSHPSSLERRGASDRNLWTSFATAGSSNKRKTCQRSSRPKSSSALPLSTSALATTSRSAGCIRRRVGRRSKPRWHRRTRSSTSSPGCSVKDLASAEQSESAMRCDSETCTSSATCARGRTSSALCPSLRPPDIKTADDELRTLTEANGPYIRLFRTISENTTLDLDRPFPRRRPWKRAKIWRAGRPRSGRGRQRAHRLERRTATSEPLNQSSRSATRAKQRRSAVRA